MKVIVNESLGLEYAWDVISSCDQNGMQAIADNQNNEILFYDPKNRQYCTNKDLMNADFSIHDVFTDKSARDQVMKPTSGNGFEDFATKWDALQKSDDPDVIKTKNCSMIRFNANEGKKSKFQKKIGKPKKDDGLSQDDLDFLDKLKNTDDKFGRKVNGIEAQVSENMIDSAVVYFKDKSEEPMTLANVHDLEGVFDVIRYILSHEPGDIADIDHIKIGSKVYDRNDIDDYLAHEHELEELDYMYSENIDNSNDWSASEDEVEIQWMIDDKELGIESGSTETVVIDLDLVDCFEELVYQVELALEKEYGGMRFDYDDEWILVDEDNLLKRFGYNMNESETNGGTMDVTLTFTHGHYGKKLKAGAERTIKVDLSTAPDELYDVEDFMKWIAGIATDQIPGGGYISKYDFEIPDEDADRLIKAVKGDEGFGPDVDVDFDDPDSIPSEIPYVDALKIYQKMREAYDERKLNYNKYGVLRKKVVDGVVNYLLKHNSLDDLAEKWFIDYGTMNGWGWKTSFKYSVAYALHEIDKKKHPDEHEVLPQRDNWRGWHEDKCSCGFGSSSDSSD